MVRAGEARGSLAAIFERLAEFERTRDDLRSYIISSMIYPALLALVGLASILVLLNFVVPRFASIFEESHMKIPLPTQIMLEASQHRAGLLVDGRAGALVARTDRCCRATSARGGPAVVGHAPPEDAAARATRCGRRKRRGSRAPWRRWWRTACRWCSRSASPAAILNNKTIAGALEGVAQGVKRGEGIAGADAQGRRVSRRWRRTC